MAMMRVMENISINEPTDYVGTEVVSNDDPEETSFDIASLMSDYSSSYRDDPNPNELVLVANHKGTKDLRAGDLKLAPFFNTVNISGVNSSVFERLSDPEMQKTIQEFVSADELHPKLGLTKHQLECFTVTVSTMFAVDRPFWFLQSQNKSYTKAKYEKEFRQYMNSCLSYLVVRYMFGFRGLPRLAFEA